MKTIAPLLKNVVDGMRFNINKGMSRSQMMEKLKSAIQIYRGVKDESNGKWIRLPAPRTVEIVRRRLDDLGLDVQSSMNLIDEFKNATELRAWIATLE